MSVRKHPELEWQYLDESGATCPWYTIGSLNFLMRLPLAEFSVFEYGCGRSSGWWRNRSRLWAGVDSSKDWAEKAGCLLAEDREGYVSSCCGAYDLVIVDGVYRNECVSHAVCHLHGYLVVDNWNQATADLPESSWTEAANCLKCFPCWIFKEPEHRDWKTAIFKIP